MAHNPRYSYGGELRHGRTMGSKNGVSNTPGYKAVGQKAKGININGKWFYPEDIAAANARQQGINAAKTQQFSNSQLGKQLQQKAQQTAAARAANEAQIQRGIEAGRQRAAAKAAEEARNKGIGGFFRKASNALGGVAGNVGKALASAGGNIRNTMKKTGDTVGNWLRDRRNDLGNLWDGKAGTGNGRDEASRLNAQADLDRRIAEGNRQAGRTERYHEKARSSRANRAEAQRRQEAYDNSIVGRLENARNNVGNWLNDRRRDVAGAVDGARQRIGEAWDGKAGAGNGRDEASRLNAQADLDRRIAEGNRQAGRTERYHEKARSSRANRAEAQRRQEAYDNSIVGRFENARNNVGNWLNDRKRDLEGAANKAGRALDKAWDGKAGAGSAKDLRNQFLTRSVTTNGNQSKVARDLADQYKKQYDRSIKGRLEKTGDTVKKAAEFLNDRVGDARSALKSAKDTAVQRASELKNTITSLPKNVQKLADSIISDIKSGKTAAEIQAKAIELENLVQNAVNGPASMPSDSYLDRIDPPKKKKK